MILVTGGTGLVGSHLLFKLIEKGYQVRATYRTQKKIAAVKHVFSYYSEEFEGLFSKIEWVEANINDIPKLTHSFRGVTHVYHCAARVSFAPDEYYDLRRINIEGTANIVNLCITNSIKKLCYVSSIAAIGHPENNDPINEETHWNSEEDHSVYAITKYGAEMEVWRGTQEGLDSVVVNPGIIIGPGFWRYGSGSLFKRIYKGMSRYTSGVTAYVGIYDVVNSMIQLMESDLKNQRYILVSENLSFKDFATRVAQQINVTPPRKKASKLLLKIAWRWDLLRHILRKKRRRLTRHMTKTIARESYYSHEKIVTDLGFTFKPIDVSIFETSQLFLKDLE